MITIILLLVFASNWIEASPAFDDCLDEYNIPNAFSLSEDVDLAYDSLLNLYFAVFVVTEGNYSYPRTSVLGQFLDHTGKPIGSNVPIYTYADDIFMKRFARVEYNSVTRDYLVLWENDYDGYRTDFDIYCLVISSFGEPKGYVWDISYASGIEKNIDVIFDDDQMRFVVVYGWDWGDGSYNIVYQTLDLTGSPLTYKYWESPNISDSIPAICLDTKHRNTFILFEETIDNKKQIVGLILNESDALAFEPRVYGREVDSHAIKPDCAFSSYHDFFVVVYNWIPVADSNISGISSLVVNATTGDSQINLFQLGTENEQDNNPQINYSPYSDEFMIVFETGSTVTNTFNIYGHGFFLHTIDELTSSISIYNISVNINNSGHEHDPRLQYNSKMNQFLVVWGHGNPHSDRPNTVRSEPHFKERKDDTVLNEKDKRNSVVEGKFVDLAINGQRKSGPNQRREAPSASNSHKRADPTVSIYARLLCDFETEKTPLFDKPSAPKKVVDNSVKKALAASLVPSIFVILLLVGILVFVVWGKDKLANMRAKKYALSEQ